jgi:hypothetical protein
MGFTNLLREMGNRSIGQRRLSGWVVNNKDPEQNQRVRVRIHDLHEGIPDDKLPWFAAGDLPSYSGSADLGNHGPLPPVGSKVWVTFDDDTQYHGTYHGAVVNSKNQIPEFTGKDSIYGPDYPQAYGSVDESGNLSGTSTIRDTKAFTHVSGTGHEIDGRGNFSAVINGDAERNDNPKAQKKYPKGGTFAIFGDMTLYVSGEITIQCKGDANINANGDVSVSSKGTMYLSATTAIKMDAPQITSRVAITLGSGKAVTNVGDKTPPTPRQRPTPSVNADIDTY